MSGSTLDDNAFLAAPKELLRTRIRWRSKPHPDYAEARIGVAVIGNRRSQGRLILQAHLHLRPRKYSFTLVYRAMPVSRLDVNPARAHYDTRTLATVWDTHWQSIPDFGVATVDSRNLVHAQWLNEFLKRTNIRAVYSYNPPPSGEEQLLLPL